MKLKDTKGDGKRSGFLNLENCYGGGLRSGSWKNTDRLGEEGKDPECHSVATTESSPREKVRCAGQGPGNLRGVQWGAVAQLRVGAKRALVLRENPRVVNSQES